MNDASAGFLLLLCWGLLLARLLPPRVFINGSARCGRWIGHVAGSRDVVARNLERIARFRERARTEPVGPAAASRSLREAGPAPRAIRPEEVFEHYGRYWGEFLALAAHPGLYGSMRIRVEGRERLRQAAARGPVCILTAHLGNWDLGARWAATELPRLAVIAEPLKPRALFRLFTRLRRAAGSEVFPTEGAGLRIYRHLKGGGHLAIVADRAFGSGARLVPMFDGYHALPAAGMDLAMRAGARLVPAFLLREGDGYAIRVYPALNNEPDPVQAFARILEEEITQTPEQWCVLYPLHETTTTGSRSDMAQGGHRRGAAVHLRAEAEKL
jgi:KDO2-lipid IV(A) lauroyltransferase